MVFGKGQILKFVLLCALSVVLSCANSYAGSTPSLSVESIADSSVFLLVDLSRAKKPITLKKSKAFLDRACDSRSFKQVLSIKSPSQRLMIADYVGQAVSCTYRARLVAKVGRANITLRSRKIDLDLSAPVDPGTPIPLPTQGPRQSVIQPKLAAGQSECPSGFANAVVDRTNQYRAGSGLPAFGVNEILAAAARVQTIKMPSLPLSDLHNGWFETLMSMGYAGTHMAQNVAYTYPCTPNNTACNGPYDLVDGWMASPGHRANILDPKNTHIGVGCIIDNSGKYWWAQDFGNN